MTTARSRPAWAQASPTRLAHRDGARTFSGTRITDPEVLRTLEPWLASWVEAGVRPVDAADAAELATFPG